MTLQEAITKNKDFPVKMETSDVIYCIGQLWNMQGFSAKEVLTRWEVAPLTKIVWECTNLKRHHAIGPDNAGILKDLEAFKNKKIRVTVEVIK